MGHGLQAHRSLIIDSPITLLSPLPVLLRPRLDEQADAGDVAVRDVAAGLLAAGENAECCIHATRLAFQRHHSPRFTLLPLLVEKIPFFILAALTSVVTFVVQKHGGAVEAIGKPALGRARRERADFVWPLSGEAVLADGSGGYLSSPRSMAAGEGGAGGRVDPGLFPCCFG